MTKTFYLLRHGDKMRTIGDPPLSDKGHQQAKTTAEFLRGFPIQRILASPILRTRQTAQYLSESLALPVTVEPLLRERANWGDDPTQSLEDFLAMWVRATRERDWVPPVGDSSRAAGARLQRVVENHAEPHEHIALVSHGGVIADFARNVFSDEVLNQAYPEFTTKSDTVVFECSLTIVEYRPDQSGYRLRLLGSTTHLE